MKKHIELHQKKVAYTLKVSNRARRMRLAIYCDGAFVVTVPQNMNQGLVEQFIIKKSQWVLDKLEYFKSFSGTLFIKSTKKDFADHKEEALALAERRVEHFNKIYKFRFNKINIKNQKTRWGSCSRKGNLNFNYKIALLPQRMADYIIVHELCHLAHADHGPAFYRILQRLLPDWQARKARLERLLA